MENNQCLVSGELFIDTCNLIAITLVASYVYFSLHYSLINRHHINILQYCLCSRGDGDILANLACRMNGINGDYVRHLKTEVLKLISSTTYFDNQLFSTVPIFFLTSPHHHVQLHGNDCTFSFL